jgi:RimJ/RimL family protein N-acetyltransferase
VSAPWTIRPATLDDAAGILALDAAMAREPDVQVPFDPDEVRTLDQQRKRLEGFVGSDQLDLVAEVQGLIVGEVGLARWTRLRAGAHVRTLWIGVTRAWRGHGLGRALMEEALAWARARPEISRIELTVFAENERAITMYRRFGFEIEGTRRRVMRKDGRWIDDHVMALML